MTNAVYYVDKGRAINDKFDKCNVLIYLIDDY